jgi:predicted metal-binding membrane protein
MSLLDTSSVPRRLDTRRLLTAHPEALAAVVVALAWGVLLLLGHQAFHQVATSGPAVMSGMPGMASSHSPADTAWSRAAAQVPQWVLMTVAMMGPVALAGIRHTGRNSLRWRRGRAMAEFAAAYLAVWTAFGALVLLAVARGVSPFSGTAELGAVLAVAALWQLSARKRRSLRSCHRSIPLPLHGWPAERGAAVFGFRHGLSCIGSCWCLMLVMVFVTDRHLLWTIAITASIAIERWARHPRRASQLVAGGLAAASLATLAIAFS